MVIIVPYKQNKEADLANGKKQLRLHSSDDASELSEPHGHLMKASEISSNWKPEMLRVKFPR